MIFWQTECGEAHTDKKNPTPTTITSIYTQHKRAPALPASKQINPLSLKAAPGGSDDEKRNRFHSSTRLDRHADDSTASSLCLIRTAIYDSQPRHRQSPGRTSRVIQQTPKTPNSGSNFFARPYRTFTQTEGGCRRLHSRDCYKIILIKINRHHHHHHYNRLRWNCQKVRYHFSGRQAGSPDTVITKATPLTRGPRAKKMCCSKAPTPSERAP